MPRVSSGYTNGDNDDDDDDDDAADAADSADADAADALAASHAAVLPPTTDTTGDVNHEDGRDRFFSSSSQGAVQAVAVT